MSNQQDPGSQQVDDNQDTKPATSQPLSSPTPHQLLSNPSIHPHAPNSLSPGGARARALPALPPRPGLPRAPAAAPPR